MHEAGAQPRLLSVAERPGFGPTMGRVYHAPGEPPNRKCVVDLTSGAFLPPGEFTRSEDAAAMIGERLPVDTLGPMAVDLPRLAQLAPGPGIARATTFVMHGSLPLMAPAFACVGARFEPKWPEAKSAE